MSITINFSSKDLENLDNLESDDMEYVDVPYGTYEVEVASIKYKESKKGIPMATIRFKVVGESEYAGNSIFYNQLVDVVWKFKKVAKLLDSLKSDVNISSANYVVDGQVDFDLYAKMLESVYDDITAKGYEYALNYEEDKKGYPTYTIVDFFPPKKE